jgi:hypothetical protein
VSRNIKLSAPLIIDALVGIIGFALFTGDEPAAAPDTSLSDRVVCDHSQRLSAADDAEVTFVDFEWEACRAAHRAIETLREMYDGRATFVVRNSPLHEISEQAARAAEAAAAQGARPTHCSRRRARSTATLDPFVTVRG